MISLKNNNRLFFENIDNFNLIELKDNKKSRIKIKGLRIMIKGRTFKSTRSRKILFSKGALKRTSLNVHTEETKNVVNSASGKVMIKLNILRSYNK